jgi:hypothetical protein
MKTVKDIDDEINDLRIKMKNVPVDAARSLISTKITKLRQVKYYLESVPSEDFVRKQMDELLYRIAILDEKFPKWVNGKIGGRDELRRRYNNTSGFNQAKMQLKVLQAILS